MHYTKFLTASRHQNCPLCPDYLFQIGFAELHHTGSDRPESGLKANLLGKAQKQLQKLVMELERVHSHCSRPHVWQKLQEAKLPHFGYPLESKSPRVLVSWLSFWLREIFYAIWGLDTGQISLALSGCLRHCDGRKLWLGLSGSLANSEFDLLE